LALWIHTKRSADRLLEAIILAVAELGELCRAYWQYGKRMASGSTTSEGLLPTSKMAGRYKPGWMLSSRETTKHTTSLLRLADIDHPTTYDTYPALGNVYVIAIAHYVRLLPGQS
jgi:hypothetical protein